MGALIGLIRWWQALVAQSLSLALLRWCTDRHHPIDLEGTAWCSVCNVSWPCADWSRANDLAERIQGIPAAREDGEPW